MPKVDICPLDKKCVQKFQHYIEHQCSPPHQKQRHKPCFRSLVFFYNNIILVLHPFYMFIIVLFHLCPHETLRIWNFNTFLQKCSSIQDCASSLHYHFCVMLLHLHQPSLCFCHCLHLCGLMYV
jgi:hypothetical protein